MLGAIAQGASRVEDLSPCEDVRSTSRALRALGVQIGLPTSDRRNAVIIDGRGLRGLQPPGKAVDAGNAGTTIRLLAGILAGQPFESVISGDESLRQRPMDRIVEPLARMGARIQGEGGRAPLVIRGGKLSPICYELPVASAQVKSCLLLAGLYAQGATTVIEPLLTRDHTERLLQSMGDALTSEALVGRSERAEEPNRITIRGNAELEALSLAVPGDFSSAAFLVAAAVLLPGSELVARRVGVNPTRAGFLDVLRRMGAAVESLRDWQEGGEPAADLLVRSAPALQATEIGAALIPRLIDEIPLIAVMATQAEGATVIRDAGELRRKETDRLSAVSRNLERMGADVEELDDGLVIEGPQRLKGAPVESYEDHRVAMAFSIAGLIADGTTVVRGAEWADISFPGFYERLEQIVHV